MRPWCNTTVKVSAQMSRRRNLTPFNEAAVFHRGQPTAIRQRSRDVIAVMMNDAIEKGTEICPDSARATKFRITSLGLTKVESPAPNVLACKKGSLPVAAHIFRQEHNGIESSAKHCNSSTGGARSH
jgi:hypothetical protein